MVQVVCVDYPRPELDNTSNFLEAAYLSSTFRNSPRPQKPLEVVIAGAGEWNDPFTRSVDHNLVQLFVALQIVFV